MTEAAHSALATPELRAAHWETIYQTRGPEKVSWYQPEPTVSLQLIQELGISPEQSLIDVGGGASTLVDVLVAGGFTDVSVLDVSSAALEAARKRLGPGAPVHWLHEDLLAWKPERRYEVWHDRAVFHFLTAADDRDRYLSALHSALAPGGQVILATFALDGPERCSNLPVARYDGETLGRYLAGLEVVKVAREEHITPAGVVQPFTWVAARMSS